ncbi:MAG TPA: hypothetical protein PJ982_01365, partial [Lacipirellulaceae bacterium]|nr:hypothetical protein [Lacipirellulaceae bacterium]
MLNDAGNTAFLASGGVWLAESGTLAAVARTGSPAPGSPLQDEFSGFQSLLSGYRPSLALNGEGQVAFWAMTELSGEGIWTGRPESLASVAVNGDSAPGAESGVTFSRFSLLLGKEAPALNAAGQTAFTGYLSGEELDLLSSRGIWSNGSGDLALVARGGTQAPGTENGINFDLFEAPVLNGTGRTAFTALLTGDGVNSSNNYGIWAEGVDGLELIARRGNSAPGLPSGVTFAGFGGQQQLVLNHAGQVAFMAALSGNGLNPSTQKGIWATDHNGELQLIVRTGSQIEVAAGEFRTVIDLQFVGGSGNQDGRPSGFNDRGQLAFSATFVGGVSGVFVSNAVAEPSAYGDFNGDGAVNGADLLAWQRGESPEALS